MAIIAAGLILLVRTRADLLQAPYRTGMAYGFVTYLVMNWLVVPLRFGTPLPPSLLSAATQLFAHIVLVGVPMMLIMRRFAAARTRK